jgi:uncharacterized circularly permuted ATP-grasp superfamily protein
VTAPPDGPPWAGYVPEHRDEAIDAHGAWRPDFAAALRGVTRSDLAQITEAVADDTRGAGMVFPTAEGAERFVIDPVPRILSADEWDLLGRGVAQRARALNAFVADVHGARRAVHEGAIPARVIEQAEHHEPAARDLAPACGVWIGVAGLDVIRGPDGAFQVLEDNVRTPSGIAYALAARALVQQALGLAAVPARPIHGATELLAEALAAAAPAHPARDGTGPHVVVLTDGPGSPAYWEHRVLAHRLDAPLVTAEELELDGDERLVLRDAPQRPIDSVYRRTDSSTIEAPAHRLLRRAMTAGTVGAINGFGTGVADDKLTHAYVEDLIRLFLGEEPLLASVPTYDLQRPERREEVLDRLTDMVVKPRGGAGGAGVTICAHADDALLEATRTAIRATPEAFVAQELVLLSTHPTAVDGALQPRHVDLRPFAFVTPDGAGDTIARVVGGGLTRVALKEGSMIVNSSQDGGAKDTWVMP